MGLSDSSDPRTFPGHDPETGEPLTTGPSESTESTDPFGPEAAPGLQLIMLMRIYDVLMGLYMEAAPERAEDLLNAHLEGFIVSPAPAFNGRFLTNEQADEEKQ